MSLRYCDECGKAVKTTEDVLRRELEGLRHQLAATEIEASRLRDQRNDFRRRLNKADMLDE
jgi:hypothetical protein